MARHKIVRYLLPEDAEFPEQELPVNWGVVDTHATGIPLRWMAPELLHRFDKNVISLDDTYGEHCNPTTDMYSFGCVCYEVLVIFILLECFCIEFYRRYSPEMFRFVKFPMTSRS